MGVLGRNEKLLVEQHLYLVRGIILGTIRMNESVQGLGYDDLYQTGCEALCHAAIRYDPGRNVSFKTFASHVIRNRLLSHCRMVNHTQERMEYLDAPLADRSGLTYAELLADEVSVADTCAEHDILRSLSSAENRYSGTCQKGITALKLKCMGQNNVNIAARFGVRPNHVAAWISKAAGKLRADSQFLCLLQP